MLDRSLVLVLSVIPGFSLTLANEKKRLMAQEAVKFEY